MSSSHALFCSNYSGSATVGRLLFCSSEAFTLGKLRCCQSVGRTLVGAKKSALEIPREENRLGELAGRLGSVSDETMRGGGGDIRGCRFLDNDRARSFG